MEILTFPAFIEDLLLASSWLSLGAKPEASQTLSF